MEELFIAAPLLLTLGACIAGVGRAEAFRPDWKAVLGGMVVSLAVAALVFTWRDSEVEGRTVFIGVLIGALVLGAFPVWVYFALGRALAGHRVLLAVLFVASVVPLYLYCFLMLLLVVDVVGCPPDAYECPL
jgi:hypothetical protein